MDDNDERSSTVQRYNPDINLWQEVPPLNFGRSSVCAVADGNYLYAIGGIGTSGFCNKVERFDPDVNSWTKIASTQANRRQAAGVSLESKIFVFGGVDISDGCPCEVYNKVTDVWSNIETTIAPRATTSAVVFQGQIFVFGKFEPDENESKEVTLQVYNVDKNTWKPCSSGVSLCSDPYICKLSTVRILRAVLDACEEISKT